MRWGVMLVLLILAGQSPATGAQQVLRFSTSTPGTEMPDGWEAQTPAPNKPLADIRIVADGGDTVLQIDADHAAGAVEHALDLPPETTVSWRWKVDHSVAHADLARKQGDDFAARLYVFFDVPRSSLSLTQRIKLSMARHFSGRDLPTAALCYVWDNTHAVGTLAANAYYSGVKLIVLQSGNDHAGQWQSQQRDLAADFRAAFGHPAPRITGVALGVDTDNSEDRAQARFGDLHFTATASSPGAQEPGS